MKLLATDYDGTLRYAQDVMPEDLKSIEEWKNKGNKFVIVTGRSKESIDAQIKLFNLPCDYLITIMVVWFLAKMEMSCCRII